MGENVSPTFYLYYLEYNWERRKIGHIKFVDGRPSIYIYIAVWERGICCRIIKKVLFLFLLQSMCYISPTKGRTKPMFYYLQRRSFAKIIRSGLHTSSTTGIIPLPLDLSDSWGEESAERSRSNEHHWACSRAKVACCYTEMTGWDWRKCICVRIILL